MYRLYLCTLGICALILCACDLQPKIASIPDSIGEFISNRYPALLADPATQPEIYNSAVTDYGVYASPELYGGGSAPVEDYVLYASADDYVLEPQAEEVKIVKTESKPKTESKTKIEQQPKNKTEPQPKEEQEIAKEDVLVIPVYSGNSRIQENQDDIIVVHGDTLYSLAKKNNISVQELAKINNLREPYTLYVGQKINKTFVDPRY